MKQSFVFVVALTQDPESDRGIIIIYNEFLTIKIAHVLKS